MSAERDPAGRFRPGTSGNPRGKRPGKHTDSKLRAQLREAAPKVIECIIERAKDGDMQAAKIVLERIVSPLRPTDTPAPLPPGTSLESAPQAIISALIAGTLTPDQGSRLATALAQLAQIAEAGDIVSRLDALEVRLNEPPRRPE